MLVGLAVLILWGLLAGPSIPASAFSDDPEATDSALYGAIVDRMDEGLSYYDAVAVEQPARGYPTSPAMTVREPTLAWVTSVLGHDAMVGILWAIVAIAVLLSIWVYERTERSRSAWYLTAGVASLAVAIYAVPAGADFHEVWVSPLVCIGLLCWGVGWVRISVLPLLAAALIRELVAPVLLILLVMAWWRGRRREAVMWATAIAAFWAFYAVHLLRVHDLVSGSDQVSPGWFAHGGWPFVVGAVRASSLLAVLPFWAAAVLVPLGLVGWLARAGRLHDAVGLFLLSYAVLFCFVGRPNNAYWGSFIAVLIMPGIVFGLQFVWGSVVGREAFWRGRQTIDS